MPAPAGLIKWIKGAYLHDARRRPGQSSRADRARDIIAERNYFYDCQPVRAAAEVLPEFNVPRVRNDPNACPPASYVLSRNLIQ